MLNKNWTKNISAMAICAASVLVLPAVQAATAEPVEMIYNFQAIGEFQNFDIVTGRSTYVIHAVGRAPKVKENGMIRTRGQDENDDDDFKVILTDAAITFDAFNPAAPAPVVNFSCQGCRLTFPDGASFTSDPAVPLQGRAFFLYGPVAPNPASPVMTIRMAGCSGLRETTGTGKLAYQVGSICFNGVFNFDVSNPASLPATITGSSNCTIVTHSPMAP